MDEANFKKPLDEDGIIGDQLLAVGKDGKYHTIAKLCEPNGRTYEVDMGKFEEIHGFKDLATSLDLDFKPNDDFQNLMLDVRCDLDMALLFHNFFESLNRMSDKYTKERMHKSFDKYVSLLLSEEDGEE